MICYKCNRDKDIALFVLNEQCKDGHTHECRECHNKYIQEYRLKKKKLKPPPPPIVEKECLDCHVVKPLDDFGIALTNKKTGTITKRPYCKDCYNVRCRIYRKEHRDIIKKSNSRESSKKARLIYSQNHKEETKLYSQTHRDQINRNQRKHNKTEKRRKYNREYKKKKSITDINFHIANIHRSRVRDMLKKQRGIKQCRSNDLLGCSYDFLRQWLESKFQEGMTWDNYGKFGWHIDHIIPCASFNLQDPEEQKKCFHYTNLQPLWAKDNLSKGAKLVA